MQHHSERLSRAAVMADAKAICKKVVSLKQQACFPPRIPPPPPSTTAHPNRIFRRTSLRVAIGGADSGADAPRQLRPRRIQPGMRAKDLLNPLRHSDHKVKMRRGHSA
eukprot:scaffold5593_cov125-Isochrysis_galbana.AAC.7